MSRNYDFILNLAVSEIPPPARLLDFGCGSGQVVVKALAAGYDAQGTDLFESGWNTQRAAASAALGERLRVMPGPDRLPFADASFDVVISNQVFEHIRDKPRVVTELGRILRPGGRLIAIFPTREVMIEPHLKAPFVHRFANGGTAQKLILNLTHRLGLAPPTPPGRAVWIVQALEALSRDMFYIGDRSVPDCFSPDFTLIRQAEAEFIRDRIAHSRLKPLGWIFDQRFATAPLRRLCLRLANGVYVFSRV